MLQAVRVLFKGHSSINAANWVGVVHWIRMWWLLYLDISLLLCLHIYTIFFSILSSGARGLLDTSQKTLALWAPQEVDNFVFPPRILIHVLGQNWCVGGPFHLLGLGPRALFRTRILPFPHLYKKLFLFRIIIIIITIFDLEYDIINFRIIY